MIEVLHQQRGADYKGVVVRTTPMAILLFVDEPTTEVWLPKSKILDWRFVDASMDCGAADFGLTVDSLEEGDEIEVTIQKWIAKREGLLKGAGP